MTVEFPPLPTVLTPPPAPLDEFTPLPSVRDQLSAEEITKYIRRDVLAQITELERSQARAMREQAIGRGGTPAELRQRLEVIDDAIIALRAQLP